MILAEGFGNPLGASGKIPHTRNPPRANGYWAKLCNLRYNNRVIPALYCPKSITKQRISQMSSLITERLAIDGGTPVIQRELNRYKGASAIGEEEKQAVMEVLDSRSLFRYYGPKLLSKVAAFEQDFACFVGAQYAAAATNGTAA